MNYIDFNKYIGAYTCIVAKRARDWMKMLDTEGYALWIYYTTFPANWIHRTKRISEQFLMSENKVAFYTNLLVREKCIKIYPNKEWYGYYVEILGKDFTTSVEYREMFLKGMENIDEDHFILNNEK